MSNWIEENFKVKIAPHLILQCSSLNEVVDLIQKTDNNTETKTPVIDWEKECSVPSSLKFNLDLCSCLPDIDPNKISSIFLTGTTGFLGINYYFFIKYFFIFLLFLL